MKYLLYLFMFFTLAFPKSGIKIGGISVTVSLILFMIIIISNIKDILIYMKKNKIFLFIYAFYLMSLLSVTLINMQYCSTFQLAVVVILISSPLTIIIAPKVDKYIMFKLICISLIITGGYALLQYTIGIEKTAIYGLNIAYGDSFGLKPIGNGANGLEAIKMPSTYQNGNGVGLFYLLAIPCVILWRVNTKEDKYLKLVSIFLGIIGILLSGSRSIMIPFVISLPFIIKNIYRNIKGKNKILFLMILTIFFIGILFYIINGDSEFVKNMVDRYIIQTIKDPTATGRTTQYSKLFEDLYNSDLLTFTKILFLGYSWENAYFAEGVLYIFSYFGIIGFISFNLLLLYPIIKVISYSSLISIGLLCVYFCFLIDTSFNYPPGLMNYFMISGFFISFFNNIKYRETSI